LKQLWHRYLQQQVLELKLEPVRPELGLGQVVQLVLVQQLVQVFVLQALQQNQIQQLQQALRLLQLWNQLAQQFFAIHLQLGMEFQYRLYLLKPLVMAHLLQLNRPLS
jgi:hypothetical protein